MNPVTCRRCHGLMHPIDPLDPLDVLRNTPHEHMRAWRCLTCGDLIDRVIMQNRIRPMHQPGVRKRMPPRHPVFKELDVEWPVWR